MPEDILISNEELTVAVSPLGAEMRSVTDARGAERLWNGDPAYWKGRAPVLFPYAGGLIGDSLVHEGRTYEGCPKHGFARFCEFSLGTVKKDEASFTLTRSPCATPLKAKASSWTTYALTPGQSPCTIPWAAMRPTLRPAASSTTA